MAPKRRSVDPVKLEATARKVGKRLNAQGVLHAVIGGLAVAFYGYVRATADVDLLVDDLSVLTGQPLTIGMTEEIDGVRVDYIAVSPEEPFLLDALESAKHEGVIPLHALVYLKLKAGRARDKSDVIELLKRGAVHVRSVRTYLERNADEDLVADFNVCVLEAEGEHD